MKKVKIGHVKIDYSLYYGLAIGLGYSDEFEQIIVMLPFIVFTIGK